MVQVVVKAESTFYAALLECSPTLLSVARGIAFEKRDPGLYLLISDAILASESLFGRYLRHDRSRQIFGAHHPLYGRVAVRYSPRGEPVAINHFNTRLLLAFFEVQLALGFAGAASIRHQQAIEDILRGKQVQFETNYYQPFSHEDNVGIHFVCGQQGGSGYGQSDWRRFIQYAEAAMRRAYELSPGDLGGSAQGLSQALAQFPQSVASTHAADGSIPMFPIRHWTKIVGHVLREKGPAAGNTIAHPETGEAMPYIPFIDCILDMPYTPDAMVIFQSVCGSK